MDVNDTSHYNYSLVYISCKCMPCISAAFCDDAVFSPLDADDTWGPCISAGIPPLHVEKEQVENGNSKLTGQV